MKDKLGFIYKFGLILFIAIVAIVAIDKFEVQIQEESLGTTNVVEIEDTIKKTLVMCYAVEGAYPSHLSYLENYGIVFNQEKYIYEYTPQISYEFPEIKVKLR